MRISGITLPNKHVVFALTALYGIGNARAIYICEQTKIDPMKKADDLTAEEENEIRRIVETYKLEGDLKREVAGNIKRLKDIGAYRGTRHSKRLPARGQRTKTNSRTIRGNVRKTMGSGRRKVEKT
ncbi:MAG: 30S ribosomal protein S13 [Candidatus Adlerbacteria bacterium]|nr:30S ribosomal protein S13 [Candidatus Adlerbacteria bacterium]